MWYVNTRPKKPWNHFLLYWYCCIYRRSCRHHMILHRGKFQIMISSCLLYGLIWLPFRVAFQLAGIIYCRGRLRSQLSHSFHTKHNLSMIFLLALWASLNPTCFFHKFFVIVRFWLLSVKNKIWNRFKKTIYYWYLL